MREINSASDLGGIKIMDKIKFNYQYRDSKNNLKNSNEKGIFSGLFEINGQEYIVFSNYKKSKKISKDLLLKSDLYRVDDNKIVSESKSLFSSCFNSEVEDKMNVDLKFFKENKMETILN